MCRVLDVSTSGYYDWRQDREQRRGRADAQLLIEIRAIHHQSRKTYGAPRIHEELREHGWRCSRKRVARLMRQAGLHAQQKRRYRATTDSSHTLPVAENVLGRAFLPAAPHVIWAADITYIWTDEGWLYLAVVLDLFSRRVIGWSMQPTLERALVSEALEMALRAHRPAAGLVHHSDRGSQYASRDYQVLLKQYGIIPSMSRKGNCWDNAPVESFFATLKKELVYQRRYRTRLEARADLFEYVEVWSQSATAAFNARLHDASRLRKPSIRSTGGVASYRVRGTGSTPTMS